MKQTAILIILICQAFILQAQKGTLQGTILDSKNSDPLIGATVKIVNSDKGTATDIDGFFSIPNIEVGIYDIEISYVSFKTELLKNIMCIRDSPFTDCHTMRLNSRSLIKSGLDRSNSWDFFEFILTATFISLRSILFRME